MNKLAWRATAGVRSACIAKLGKGDTITTDILLKTCTALNCDIAGIMERIHFSVTVEPTFVKRYQKPTANRGLCKKKLDTNRDTQCIKIGVQLWCARRDLNPHARSEH